MATSLMQYLGVSSHWHVTRRRTSKPSWENLMQGHSYSVLSTKDSIFRNRSGCVVLKRANSSITLADHPSAIASSDTYQSLRPHDPCRWGNFHHTAPARGGHEVCETLVSSLAPEYQVLCRSATSTRVREHPSWGEEFPQDAGTARLGVFGWELCSCGSNGPPS